jgi:hypothetical protein
LLIVDVTSGLTAWACGTMDGIYAVHGVYQIDGLFMSSKGVAVAFMFEDELFMDEIIAEK